MCEFTIGTPTTDNLPFPCGGAGAGADHGQTAPPLVWSQIHVHAATSIFSGPKMPEIRVNWLGQPRAIVEGLSVHTVYYDAHFHPTTQASAPGRYGAVVTITTDGGRMLRRYLTLFRTPQPVNWDYIRLPINVKFPPQFGVDNEVAAENHENLSEFFKYRMQSAAERDSAPAIIMAGLYEATPAGDHFASATGLKHEMKNGGTSCAKKSAYRDCRTRCTCRRITTGTRRRNIRQSCSCMAVGREVMAART